MALKLVAKVGCGERGRGTADGLDGTGLWAPGQDTVWTDTARTRLGLGARARDGIRVFCRS